MPTILKITTNPVNVKMVVLLLIETFAKKEVIFEFLFSLISILLFETKLKRVGSKVKVMMNDVINPKVIIHPKSMIGLIPLKTNDKKAKIVVKTVYNIGQNILLVVKEIIEKISFVGKSFLS